MPDGLLLWKGQTEELISKSKDFTPNEKEKFRNLWKKYENRENTTTFTPESRSGDRPDWYYDAQTIVMNKRLELASQGYEVYSYSDDFTSDNSFNEEVRDFIRGYIYPEYEDYYEDLSIIAYKAKTITSTVVPNFVSTIWHQGAGFNSCYPTLSDGSLAVVGCGPLAVGQVMKYYQYPTTYNWSNMPLDYGNNTTSLFLLDVTERCNGRYSSGGTVTTITDCKNGLQSFGYSANIATNNSDRTLDNIIARKPVIMSGICAGDAIGHAWLSSGARYQHYKDSYEIWTFNTSTDFRCAGDMTKKYYHDYLFYMNWGWEYGFNGFFNDYTVHHPSSYNAYYLNRTNIYDISPNN